MPTDELKIEMYRRLLRIRGFEDAARTLQADEDLVPGPLHTSTGQEGAVVGACMALRANDYLTGNHRSHGHPIAKGSALGPLMAELLGRDTGVCGGKGGSMHLADFSVGSLGESGVVGSGIPVAAGAGLSAQIRGTEQVTICFFGDGAANQGTFHESINLAAIWQLPVVFFIENNLYAATTPASASTLLENLSDRAPAYGIPGVTVDGQDALAVHAVVSAAVARARNGEGPTLIEAKTYRFHEHADGQGIPGDYRSEAEIEAWRHRDPLRIHRERLLADGTLDEPGVVKIEDEVRAELETAVAFAKQSAFPPKRAAFTDLYATEVAPPKGTDDVRPADAAQVSIKSYLQAIYEAEREEMDRDERVILIGEDIAMLAIRGPFQGLGSRIRSAPISESGFTGAGIGAAMTGLRPIVDLTIASFVYVAMDPLVNTAAKTRYMFGGQTTIPIVFKASMWHDASFGAHHSDRPYPMFMNVPGLKVVVPATPRDAKGLLKAAVREDDPVIFFDDRGLWSSTGPVPEGDFTIPLGVADVRRPGSDVSIVAISSGVAPALVAAENLAREGISAEVIDPRTLVPLDAERIIQSVAKTGRLVIVDPATRTCGAAAEIAAIVAEEAFESLRSPIARVVTPDIQIPYSPTLEAGLYPDADQVEQAVRRLLR